MEWEVTRMFSAVVCRKRTGAGARLHAHVDETRAVSISRRRLPPPPRARGRDVEQNNWLPNNSPASTRTWTRPEEQTKIAQVMARLHPHVDETLVGKALIHLANSSRCNLLHVRGGSVWFPRRGLA